MPPQLPPFHWRRFPREERQTFPQAMGWVLVQTCFYFALAGLVTIILRDLGIFPGLGDRLILFVAIGLVGSLFHEMGHWIAHTKLGISCSFYARPGRMYVQTESKTFDERVLANKSGFLSGIALGVPVEMFLGIMLGISPWMFVVLLVAHLVGSSNDLHWWLITRNDKTVVDWSRGRLQVEMGLFRWRLLPAPHIQNVLDYKQVAKAMMEE